MPSQWLTPERKVHLIRLASSGECVLGHRPPELTYLHLFVQGFFEHTLADMLDGETSNTVCYNCPHLYGNYIDTPIQYWKEDDREARAEQRRLEQRMLHIEGYNWGRQFDPIARERFFETQPAYYLEGIGLSVLTFRRRMKVRIASAYTRLYVTLPKGKLNRNKRKKLRRRQVQNETQYIERLCQQAVDDYWRTLPRMK